MSISWPATPSCSLTSANPLPPRATPARPSPPPPAHPIAAPQTESPAHPYLSDRSRESRALYLPYSVLQRPKWKWRICLQVYREGEREQKEREKREGWNTGAMFIPLYPSSSPHYCKACVGWGGFLKKKKKRRHPLM